MTIAIVQILFYIYYRSIKNVNKTILFIQNQKLLCTQKVSLNYFMYNTSVKYQYISYLKYYLKNIRDCKIFNISEKLLNSSIW